jgi:putative SOS response-associated peptidase YedK
MCGRYTLKADREALAEHFDLPEVPSLEPRYNFAPSQPVPVVRLDEAGGSKLALLRWGLIPHWSSEPKVTFSNINARAETVATSPAFRSAYRSRRCLMPADGFYEWAASPGRAKQPHYFRLGDAGPFAFAAL